MTAFHADRHARFRRAVSVLRSARSGARRKGHRRKAQHDHPDRGDPGAAERRRGRSPLRPPPGHDRDRAHRRRRFPPLAPGHVPRHADESRRGDGLGHLRHRGAAVQHRDARRAGRPGRPVHPGPAARRRHLGAPRDRVDRRVPVRARRSGGRHREDGRAGAPGSCRSPSPRAATTSTRSPASSTRPIRRCWPTCGREPVAAHRVRAGDRGAGPPPRPGHPRLHHPVLRQHPGQRPREPAGVHRVRPAARSRAGRLDHPPRPLPQLHGRPHHAADDRRGPGRAQPPVRHRGPVAGALRAVHPVGARRRLRRRPAAAGRRRRADRPRRGALRADEAAAAQRQPSGAVLPGLPGRVPARARGHHGPAVRRGSCWTT